MPDAVDVNDIASFVTKRVRDAAYVAVGLGVLGLQRAQAARHDLAHQDRVDEGVDRVRTGVATGAQQVGEWIDGVRALVSSQLSPLGSQLPEPARDLATKARARLEEVGSLLRHLASPGA